MRVYDAIQRHLEAAGGYVERTLAEGRTLDGTPAHCRASMRSGRPCRRDPLPGLSTARPTGTSPKCRSARPPERAAYVFSEPASAATFQEPSAARG